MNNYTEAVINTNEPGNLKFRVPLEKQMRILATNPGTFVLGILDCCRENFSLTTRGTGGAVDEEDEFEDYCNLFITHGCAPNLGVDARSTISSMYFQKLKQFARQDGSVIIPGRMTTWTPGNNGEHMPKHSHELKLQITNYSGPVQMNTGAAQANAAAADELRRQAEEQKREHERQMAEMRQALAAVEAQKRQQQAAAAQQQAAAAQQNEQNAFNEKWRLKETPKHISPLLMPWMGMIEGVWIAAYNACPPELKRAIKDHDDKYHSNIPYQAQFNHKIWQVFAKFKDGSGAIHRNGQWIGFCNGLAAAELDVPLSEHENYQRWDGMNGWNTTHAGVTYQDYLEYQYYFTRQTYDRMVRP